MEKLIKYFKSVENYVSLVFWLLREGLKGQLCRSLTVVFLSFLGVGTVAISFVLLVGYARHRISGAVFQYKGYVLGIPDGAMGLLMVACGALLFGVVSALCTYWSQSKVLKLSSTFHHNAIVRSISVLGDTYLRPELDNVKFLAPNHDQRHIATIYTNYLSMSLKMLLDAVQPAVTLIAAGTSLCYLNFFATLALSPLMVVYLFTIYVIGFRSTALQGNYLTRISSASPTLFEFYKYLSQTSNPAYSNDLIEKVLAEQHVSKILEPFYGRLLASYQSGVASQLFLVVSMVWLFVVFGFALGQDSNSWTSILAYLIALRFTGQSIKKCATLLVGVSRFYPAIRVYKEFIYDTEQTINIKEKFDETDIDDDSFSLENQNIESSVTQQKMVYVLKGKPCFALCLNAGKTHLLSGRIKTHIEKLLFSEKPSLRASVYFHGTPKIVPILSLKDWALGSTTTEIDDENLRRVYSELNVIDEIEALPEGLETRCTPEIIDSLSREAAYAVMSAYILLHEKRAVVIDLNGFYPLDQNFQKYFLKAISNNFIFFFSNNLDTSIRSVNRLGISPQAPVIMFSEDTLLGYCDIAYVKENRDELEAYQLPVGSGEQPTSVDDTLEFDDQAFFS